MNKWIQTLTLLTITFAAHAEEAILTPETATVADITHCLEETTEKTFTMIKPNAVEAEHIHDILGVFAKNGLHIVQTKRVLMTQEEAEQFYSEHKGKPFFNDLVKFITSGPVVAVELEGPRAVEKARSLMGATDPAKAEIGTIRNLFGESITANAIHGSDSQESAVRELSFFFHQQL